METTSYEKIIVSGIKGLPIETLREIADFVYFIRRRAIDPKSFEEQQISALMEREFRANLIRSSPKRICGAVTMNITIRNRRKR